MNLLKQFFDIRREEWPKAILMSVYFFLVIATFQALKPMKRGAFLSYYGETTFDFLGRMFSGPEAEQIAKVLNMVFAYVIAIVFTLMVRKLARQNVILIFCAVFGASFVLYALLLSDLSVGVVWSFYVFGDMFNSAMVALFWAFMNDTVVADEAKRVYGIVGLGGVIGGLVGNTIVKEYVETLGREPILLLCIAPMVVIAAIGLTVNKMAEKKQGPQPTPAAIESTPKTNAAFEGAKLVFSSKYLLAIAGILGLYEIVSNIVDFQLSATVAQFVTGDLEKDAYFGLVGFIVAIVSIFVQLFLTSLVMKRFGVGVALLFLPFSILLGSLGFLIVPTLLFATMMSASDNSLNYSINQSAKEALYVPTSRDEKYKAKAFIDMFVQRFAKVIAVVVNLVVVAYVSIENVRWLSLVAILVIVAWIGIARFAGKKFEEISQPAV
ncbi:MAG TPA: Npt1/Npt2 family nucleotide transporter [bacterium]